jgi:hypothetical protein
MLALAPVFLVWEAFMTAPPGAVNVPAKWASFTA